jgi:hypothetical protein
VAEEASRQEEVEAEEEEEAEEEAELLGLRKRRSYKRSL